MIKPRAVILLAAGSGSRLKPLTSGIPKCLLPVGNKVVLDWILDEVLTSPREVVIVTGYCGYKVEEHIQKYYFDKNIKIVRNENYSKDVNILSVDVAVNSLDEPQNGYSIVETDLLLDSYAWNKIINNESLPFSFWVTRGCYSSELTGGIVHVAESSAAVDQIAYVPEYDVAYNGWNKMVGILSVGSKEVDADRYWRAQALLDTCSQYYMMPWINNADELPCQIVDLGKSFAASFNTVSDYQQACTAFLKIIK